MKGKALAGLGLTLLVSVAMGGDRAPRLTHGAPVLGAALDLHLEGAEAQQGVWLLESSQVGNQGTPFGVFELDRELASVAATGVTDAFGALSLQLSLPSAASHAEEELHVQALVTDPGTPAGYVLSQALHLRIMGPRVYVTSDGIAPASGGLSIVSAVHQTSIAFVEFSAPSEASATSGDARPLFRDDFARGAVMASPSELVLFDPLFGAVIDTIPFVDASRILLRNATGDHLFVLETGANGLHARLHTLDLATGDPLSVTDLPRRSPGFWGVDGNDVAYVSELDEVTGRTYVRSFPLAAPTNQQTFQVGTDRSRVFSDFMLAEGQLFVGTRTPWGDQTVRAELTRADLGAFPPDPSVEKFEFRHNLRNLTVVRDAYALLWSTSSGFLPLAQIWGARVGVPRTTTQMTIPGVQGRGVRALAAQDHGVWGLIYSVDDDEADALHHYDLLTSQWTFVSHLTCFSGGQAVDVLRDDYVDQVAVAVENCGPVGFDDAQLILHDVASGSQTTVPVALRPVALRTVPATDWP